MEKYLLRSKIVCPEYETDYPVITHGKGCYLYDNKGNSYLDASAGSCAVSIFGHGFDSIVDVLAQQSKLCAILPAHYLTSEVVTRYLKSLCEFSGIGAKAWTCSSGSEAVENSMKAAIQYHYLNGDSQRYKIIGRTGSFHGNTLFDLDVGGMESRKAVYRPLLNNFSHAEPAYCYRCPFNQQPETCQLQCANSLRDCIEHEGAESVAAFIVEPIVGAALGGVEPDPRYLQEIRNICDEYGILLIVDEVMSGMGRTGKNFAYEHSGGKPDIIVTGKGVGGGYYPLSAFIVNAKVASKFEETQQAFWGGHTHACTPQAAVVGQYVLDYLDENRIIAETEKKGLYLRQQLKRLEKLPNVGNIRGLGLMQGVELVADKRTKKPFNRDLQVSERIGKKLKEKGVILYPGSGSVNGTEGDHILITPPLTITKKELVFMVDILEMVLVEELALQKV